MLTGPVCTRPGGPVFLADGFARTEVSLNAFGRGRQSAPMPRKGRRFDVTWPHVLGACRNVPGKSIVMNRKQVRLPNAVGGSTVKGSL